MHVCKLLKQIKKLHFSAIIKLGCSSTWLPWIRHARDTHRVSLTYTPLIVYISSSPWGSHRVTVMNDKIWLHCNTKLLIIMIHYTLYLCKDNYNLAMHSGIVSSFATPDENSAFHWSILYVNGVASIVFHFSTTTRHVLLSMLGNN